MPPAEFTSDTHRHDPYGNFKFRVKWDGRYVAGASSVSGLTHTILNVSHGAVGDPSAAHVAPRRSAYESITLERGITHDSEFEQWVGKIWDHAQGENPRKDIVIEMYNEAGEKAATYQVYRCWVSQYTFLPQPDASGNTMAIQSLTLENEGWQAMPI
ncbi:MAG: phage tail protein [Caldilineaceae bacterium]